MAVWLVELEGQPADIQELAAQFRSPRLNVKREGDRYYLRSPEYFGGLKEAGGVRAQATELLFLLSGITNLYGGYSETIGAGTVIRVNEDGSRDQFIKLEPQTLRVRSGMLIEGTGPTVGESWLTLAQQDDNVLDVLRFFQEDTGWWKLRKAYEVIESELQPSRMARLGFAPLDEILRFKKWAHYYVHGERQLPDQDHYPPLSWAKADSFLRGLLKNWLRWKEHRRTGPGS